MIYINIYVAVLLFSAGCIALYSLYQSLEEKLCAIQEDQVAEASNLVRLFHEELNKESKLLLLRIEEITKQCDTYKLEVEKLSNEIKNYNPFEPKVKKRPMERIK
jgi:hypothetical protein